MVKPNESSKEKTLWSADMFRIPPQDRKFVAVMVVLCGCFQTGHKLGEQDRRMVRLEYRLRAV
jgi:hypothetical protein